MRKEFFSQIVNLAKRYEFMVVNDFAYGRVTFDGYLAPSFLEVPDAKGVGVDSALFPYHTIWPAGGWTTVWVTQRSSRGRRRISALGLVENENRIRQGLKQMRRALTELEKELPPNDV